MKNGSMAQTLMVNKASKPSTNKTKSTDDADDENAYEGDWRDRGKNKFWKKLEETGQLPEELARYLADRNFRTSHVSLQKSITPA
jgi:hypothetical protein